MPSILNFSTTRTGDIRLSSKKGMPVVEETYKFIVEADYINQPYIEIITTPGLPIVNQSVSPSGLAVCRGKSATRKPEKALLWDVTCEFSSEAEEDSDSSSDPANPPTAWVPIYETKSERIQEVVAKDQSGATIANSAGMPFETGLSITRFIPIWSFYQFEPAGITDEVVLSRNEVVNSGTFKGKAAKTLLCCVDSSTIGTYYGQRLRLTYYSLKYNVQKWTHKRLDVGTAYKSGSTLLPYTDNDGNIILGALDGSGAKQAVGTAPAVREFDMYATSSFDFLRV